MQIPLYPLPSNPAKEITFNMPTVTMAMQFSGSNAAQEERLTTRYLNELQPQGPAWSDSATWTAQDRRTALWWIFTNSRIDTMLTSTYECLHCGDTHFVDIDMRSLDLTGVMLLEDEPEYFDCTVDGVPTTFQITHLNGAAMMQLEDARAGLPPEDAPNWHEEWINLRLLELAFQLRLADDPDDFLKAAERHYIMLTSMALETEFQPLVAAIQLYSRRTAHGLNVHIDKGIVSLILPPHRCKNAKEGEEALTPLHMPFRLSNFLPAFRSAWLGYVD